MAVHFRSAPVIALLTVCLAIRAGARPMGGFGLAPAPGPEGGMAGCPPLGLEPVDNFNVTEYISAPWFVLAQVTMLVIIPKHLVHSCWGTCAEAEGLGGGQRLLLRPGGIRAGQGGI